MNTFCISSGPVCTLWSNYIPIKKNLQLLTFFVWVRHYSIFNMMANGRKVNTLVHTTHKSSNSLDSRAFDRLFRIAFGSSNFSNISCTLKAKHDFLMRIQIICRTLQYIQHSKGTVIIIPSFNNSFIIHQIFHKVEYINYTTYVYRNHLSGHKSNSIQKYINIQNISLDRILFFEIPHCMTVWWHIKHFQCWAIAVLCTTGSQCKQIICFQNKKA